MEHLSRALALIDVEMAPQLSAALVARKLANNRDGYGMPDGLAFGTHQRELRIIREQLLKVPLVHVTPGGFDVRTPIVPNVDRPASGNTTDFDRSLGLDWYVFFR